jgi:PAS domain S-box-containing protein
MPSAAFMSTSSSQPSVDPLFDLPVGLFCVANMEGVVLRVSKGWTHELGWSAQEVEGKPYSLFIHPDDLEITTREYNANVDGSKSLRFESRYRHKDGSYRILQWSSAPRVEDGLIYAAAWDVTALRDQERWLKLLETVAVRTNDGVLIATEPGEGHLPDNEVLFANEALLRATGYESSDVVGKSSAVFFGPKTDRDEVLAVRQRVRDDEQAYGRTVIYRKDGHPVWVEYALTAVEDPSNDRTLWITIARDITDRVHRDLALQESNDRYRLLFDANPAPMWVFDRESLRFLAVNDAAVDTYGYSKEQFLAMGIQDIRPPEHAAVVENAARHEMRSLHRSGTWTHRYADGSDHQVRVTSHAIDFAGRPARMVLAMDITETLEAQARLRDSNLLLNGIIDASPLAIVSFEDDGTIRSWNPAAVRILGLTAAEAIGRRMEDVITGSTKSAARFRELLSRKEPFTNFEGYIKRRGERVDLSVSLSLLDEQDGSSSGMVAVLEDISDRKRSERALKDLNRTLEQRVTARTVELTSANKELEAFCFSVAHDLRGPLRSIDGFSRAAIEDYGDKLDETGLDYLNRVRSSCQRLGSLIDSLLALSRLTRTVITVEEVDMSSLVEEAFADLLAGDLERRVRLTVQPGAKAAGDSRLLRLVIENLAENAWNFTKRKADAEISFVAEDVDGEIVYRFSDNGVGFDMTYVRKLFLPFERLHSNHDFPGNGIGLATVERIVTRHGGRVWAHGIVDGGATFSFTLNPNLSRA